VEMSATVLESRIEDDSTADESREDDEVFEGIIEDNVRKGPYAVKFTWLPKRQSGAV
jgi:hypothetical protein